MLPRNSVPKYEGIGFTVALFIAQLAFTDPVMVEQAKIGILGASLIAGIAGFLLLRFGTPSAGPSSR